jgi:ligand-binding sensor domain-containing protein
MQKINVIVMRIALLFLASLFTIFSTIAQTEKMAFKSLTTSMGLSHGDVLCFYQDHDGYIWIGTTDGLNKYDGVGFTVYKNNQKDSTSLISSYINCIYEDKQNNLWIGLQDGLCRYDRDKNNFERISFIDIHDNKFGNSVNQIFEDNSKGLWVGCSEGVYLFNRENKRFTACFKDSSNINTLMNCSGICQDKDGMLWFSFTHAPNLGIIQYNAVTNTAIQYSTQNPLYKLRENSVNCLMVDNQNNIWVGHISSGIEVINLRTKTITSYQTIVNNHNSLSNNNIFSMAQNKDGKILIGTNGGGISVFDPSTKLFCQYTASESDRSLLSNVIQRIYISRDGMVWIGCWGAGVSIYDKRFERFALYRQNKEDINSLDGSSVTCFTQDLNGNIWIATDGGGINSFNPSTGNFTRHRSDSKNPLTLTNNKVLALNKDNKGGLWAGMWQGGLNYFKIDGDKLILKKKYNFVDENDLTSNSIFNIYFNKDNELWVGNYLSGAYKYDPSTEKFKSIKFISGAITYISIRDILCDSYNDVWFASDTYGLTRMNRESGEIDRFMHDEKDSTSLIKNSINVVFEDSKKRLWVSGDGDGLNLFNRKTKSFTHYTTEQGLPDNSLVGILEDEHGNLWISSHNGISKATIDSTNSINGKLDLTFRNYTVQDGLQGKVFNRWAYYKSRTGEMYFGGLNGFNVFHPDSIKDNSYIPPVHITDFLLFNKPVIIGAKGSPLQKHISQTKKLVLNYDQTNFTFKFIALNYIFSEKNQYAYIMEGFEKDWNYVGNKKEAVYTNLDPGEYTFRVKASNNDGIWNEEGTSIKIIILPPWWNTWWFYSFILVVMIGFVFGLYRWRVWQLLAREKMLKANVKEAVAKIKVLNGLIPICASCKKIRDDKGYWDQLEGYIQSHSEAKFSHGVCPECAEKLYGDFYKKMKNQQDVTSAISLPPDLPKE